MPTPAKYEEWKDHLQEMADAALQDGYDSLYDSLLTAQDEMTTVTDAAY